MKTQLVYLAGPMAGISFRRANAWRKGAAFDLAMKDIETLSPLRFKQNLYYVNTLTKLMNDNDNKLLTNAGVFTRDFNDVKRADALLVNFLDAEVASIGTAAEIAWAWQMQKPIVVVMDPGNVHQHAFIVEMASLIVDNLPDGIKLITEILNNE